MYDEMDKDEMALPGALGHIISFAASFQIPQVELVGHLRQYVMTDPGYHIPCGVYQWKGSIAH